MHGQPPPYTRPILLTRDPAGQGFINGREYVEGLITEHLHRMHGVDAIAQNNPNSTRVGTVAGVENKGSIPGTVNPVTPLRPARATQEDHQHDTLFGVLDMRTKLLESYFFLIFILTLLHFLMYIRFLCAL